MDEVSKKFRKGELFDSLRDALPALATKLVGWQKRGAPSSREFWALKDISLSVERGEVLGIIGHNGAGKSTILKLLSGVLKPTAGTIAVNGSLSALIEIGAGFHPDLTGRENIFLNGAILGLSRARVRKKFDEIVEFSGLAEFMDTPVKRYSTGMYARLGFSVAAHVDTEILVVDEVLSVGDYVFQNKCMERMKEIVKQGSTIIFVSHNLNAVAGFCTRAILLDHGRVVEEGDTQEVIAAYMRIGETAPSATDGKDAFISRLVVRDRNIPKMRFEPGDDVWLDIDVAANKRCEKLSLTIFLRDERNINIFDTSTERLGVPSFTLVAGETRTLTFRLKLHLARGAYHLGAHIYRYDIQRMYDHRYPMGKLFVTSTTDVGGVANLYPEMIMKTTEDPRDGLSHRAIPSALPAAEESQGRIMGPSLVDCVTANSLPQAVCQEIAPETKDAKARKSR